VSLSARNWARDLKVGSSTLKSILKELGDFEQGTGEVFAHIETLVEFTELNRKTIVSGLQELVKRGFLEDTGKRTGRTKQIPIYRLIGFECDFAKAQRAEADRRGNGPKTGTISSDAGDSTDDAAQAIESEVLSGTDFPENSDSPKESQNRNSSETGTVPDSAGNSPVFGRKQSQKRDTNCLNGVLTPEARASGRGPRAAKDPEPPKPIDPAADRSWWATCVLQAFVGEIALTLWEFRNKPVTALPQRLQVSIGQAAPEIIDRYAGGLRSNDTVGQMVRDCQDSAKRILAWYQEGQAAA
jgi:hypothetical protein